MSENRRVVRDATCTFCGCVCDDIHLTVDVAANRITDAENACALGRAWFDRAGVDQRPFALVGGREASTREAIDAAARILANARFPVIYGLAETTCEAQRQAVAIADMVGGNLDTASAMSHGALGIAFPRVGESTATLGEIRNRADLLVFWGTDPVETHPRLFTRYSATANGMYVPGGRADRTVVVVDVRRTASAAAADVFVQVKPERDFEVAWVLRALVKGKRADPAIEGVTGVPLATLEDLASRMQRCRYGVLFFGAGLTARRGWQFNSGALLALAADLNEHTHFVANPVRGRGNGAGADNVVSWQTGFPFAVNLSRGYPRFNPGEFTAAELLARRDADAMLVFAADPGADFPAAAIERLRRIPVIVLGSMRAEVAAHAQVVIATATYGISAPGTVYRMDNVAVPLRPALQSACPSDDDALARIKERLRELLGGNRVPAAARAA